MLPPDCLADRRGHRIVTIADKRGNATDSSSVLPGARAQTGGPGRTRCAAVGAGFGCRPRVEIRAFRYVLSAQVLRDDIDCPLGAQAIVATQGPEHDLIAALKHEL